MAKRKTPAQAAAATWTPENLAALANAWLAANPGGNMPTPEMLASPVLSNPTYAAPAPPTIPFLTPEQQQQIIDIFNQTGTQLAQLDQADTNALATTMQQIGDPTKFDPNDKGTDLTNAVNKEAMINKTGATDVAIARGLFQSSIRAADLADIEATRQLRRNYFRDQYNTVIKANASSRKSIHDYLNASVGAGYDPNDPNSKLGGTFGSMAIENAKNNPSSPGTPGHFVAQAAKQMNTSGAPAIAKPKITGVAPKLTDPDPTRHAASLSFLPPPPSGRRRRGRSRG